MGPNGTITIIIQFLETSDPGVYNLAFGNLLPNGNIDDKVKNANDDRNKVLATIAMAIFAFTLKYPGAHVFFTGSTPERTRLYRMALTINLAELSADFDIFGVHISRFGYCTEKFEKNKTYQGFLIKRKTILNL